MYIKYDCDNRDKSVLNLAENLHFITNATLYALFLLLYYSIFCGNGFVK